MHTPGFSTDEAFARFSSTLQASGVRAALAGLLGLTDYRFIGIFRFDGDRANAAVFFDRENPEVQHLDEVPADSTYCCYVRDSGGAFTTANALLDERLKGHAAQATVLSYCGVPVMDSAGTLIGTLCHYDLVPRDPAQIDMALMLRVASELAYGQHVPPYPQPAAKRPSN